MIYIVSETDYDYSRPIFATYNKDVADEFMATEAGSDAFYEVSEVEVG